MISVILLISYLKKGDASAEALHRLIAKQTNYLFITTTLFILKTIV